MGDDGVAVPQQQRSRESFARVRAATVQLLTEKGPSGVVIAEVSALAGVSVGTIYGRVGSRTNLLRLVHREELARMSASMTDTLEALEIDDDLGSALAMLVHAFVAEMAKTAPLLSALKALASEDPELAGVGPAVWRDVRAAVVEALGRALGPTSRSLDPEWAEWLFEVMFATTLHRQEEVAEVSDSSLEVDQAGFEARLTRSVMLLVN